MLKVEITRFEYNIGSDFRNVFKETEITIGQLWEKILIYIGFGSTEPMLYWFYNGFVTVMYRLQYIYIACTGYK